MLKKNKSLCKSCQKNIKRTDNTENKPFQRNCPVCQTTLGYKSKYDYQTAIKKNSLCFTCRGTKNLGGKGNLYERLLKKGYSEEEAKKKYEETEKKRLGTREGYRHSEETLKKIKKGGFSKHYEESGLICQGTYEKKWIEKLKKKVKFYLKMQKL